MVLLALRRGHRRRRQHRRPGRAVAPTPISAVPTERAVLTASTEDIHWLDEVLRGLAHALAQDPGGRLPDLLAAGLTTGGAELVLAQPVPDAPGAWTVHDGGSRWRLARDADTGYDHRLRAVHATPYPALTGVGTSVDGTTWLLDLEHLGALTLVGDARRCLDLARYMAVELSQNPWPELVNLTVAGLGGDLDVLARDRVRVADDPDRVAKALAEARHRLADNTAALHEAGLDVLSGRLLNVSGDLWFPEIVLAADDALPEGEAADLRAAAADRARCGVAVVLAAAGPAPDDATGWVLDIGSDGRARIPRLGVDVLAHRLTDQAARDLAHLFATLERTDDPPVPPSRGPAAWDQLADAQGNLRPELAVPAPDGASRALDVPHLTRAEEEPPSSVLPQPTAVYVAEAPTSPEDVAALAPVVPADLTRQAAAADPTLDADLAAWHDPDAGIPKVRLLGPVTVDAPGTLPAGRPRLSWNTEVVAYLATRPGGVSADQLAEDLWPGTPGVAGTTRLRQAVSVARTWLGRHPGTGTPFLPPATPGTDGRGGIYRVEGILVDADLFRRLRLRGTTRGPDGITDLQAALDLVTGQPFDRQRPGGYAWLADTPLDHEYTAMIVDVAHLLAVHHLAAGEPDKARIAACTAGLRCPLRRHPPPRPHRRLRRPRPPRRGRPPHRPAPRRPRRRGRPATEDGRIDQSAAFVSNLRRQWPSIGPPTEGGCCGRGGVVLRSAGTRPSPSTGRRAVSMVHPWPGIDGCRASWKCGRN